MPLNRLTVQEVDYLLRTLKTKTSARTGKPLSFRTIRYAYAVLRSALQLAVGYNYLAQNPASARVRRSRIGIRSTAEPFRFFTPDQARSPLRAV